MKKQKIIAILLSMAIIFTLLSCSSSVSVSDVQLQSTKMQTICDLAVMDCYFNNVAKYTEEDAAGILWWSKDKKFWIEYSGIVSIGLDSTLITLTVQDDLVRVTLPRAKVLSSKIDDATLSADSFIIANDSAPIVAEDQTIAYAEAQEKMVETATSDIALMYEAERRAQTLLTDYINNIGEVTGVTYTIEWTFLDANIDDSTDETPSEIE